MDSGHSGRHRRASSSRSSSGVRSRSRSELVTPAFRYVGPEYSPSPPHDVHLYRGRSRSFTQDSPWVDQTPEMPADYLPPLIQASHWPLRYAPMGPLPQSGQEWYTPRARDSHEPVRDRHRARRVLQYSPMPAHHMIDEDQDTPVRRGRRPSMAHRLQQAPKKDRSRRASPRRVPESPYVASGSATPAPAAASTFTMTLRPRKPPHSNPPSPILMDEGPRRRHQSGPVRYQRTPTRARQDASASPGSGLISEAVGRASTSRKK